MGNLYCRLEPTGGGGTPLFFCAHSTPFRRRRRSSRSWSRTAWCETRPARSSAPTTSPRSRRCSRRRARPGRGRAPARRDRAAVHAEGGGRPARRRRVRRSRGLPRGVGYVYDQAGPIGEVILGAPHAQKMEVRFHGRAAHAGMYPEEGARRSPPPRRAIADLRLGRRGRGDLGERRTDPGRDGAEHRPGVVRRSRPRRARHDERKLADLVQEMLDAVTFAASLEECEVETEVLESVSRGYRFRRDDPPVRLAAAALERAGTRAVVLFSRRRRRRERLQQARPRRASTSRTGWPDIHTPDEHIAVADLEGMVDVTLALVESPREATCRLACGAAASPPIVERHEGSRGSRSTAIACVAYPRLTAPVALGDEVLVNVQARELGLGSRRVRRPVREPDARARACRRSRART